MIALWIFIGVVVGTFIMGIMCKGKIEDQEREIARLRHLYFGGKVK